VTQTDVARAVRPVADAPPAPVFRSPGLRVFSTCPDSSADQHGTYADAVASVARWSEAVGCEGILVYTDNRLVDPWLVSQIILENTTTLCPLVAVQPVYMHPYSVAKMVSSLAFLHDRRIYLNMVAGGFRRDLLALDDEAEHDDRYERLTEYTLIVKELLAGTRGLTFEGTYYRVRNLSLSPALPEHLYPGITVSGSSPAGRKAARAIGATAVKYPGNLAEEAGQPPKDDVPSGMRMGIIARETVEEAWEVALTRYPEDRKGQITHTLAMKVSDSHWHKQLSALARQAAESDVPYWLGPFENYKTFCPYLVGSYARVGAELADYMRLGFQTFILDIPPSLEELEHTSLAFQDALTLAVVT
jgi:alkanesulfonate monooxygenase